ncbi:LysR family transcriptional regulator [Ruegeria sp. HKCCD8929]|uniref:LysR family transcriptional regulator n=1 Tax=Ruegeria sp. HKCCD8929 TaxID=2683006 RepID=UPI00148817FC|nr:LysR family transcriptional regulator [Ruegeria sp. HKCCD8929]
MQIKALETFLCVADAGGFHAAARKMNVTQTAISARIRAVEQAVGQTLFTRGAGGTALTDFGRQFRPYAEQMVALWAFSSRELPGQQPNRVSIRLGAQLSIWDPLLVDLAISLEENFGKLLLTLNYDHDLNVAEAVASHVLDAALTHERPRDRQTQHEELPPERLILVENPQSEAAEALFVNLELGEQYRDHVRNVARQASGQTIFLGNCMMALRYVLRRGGRGYFPDYLVSHHLQSSELVRVPEAEDLLLPLYLVFHPDPARRAQFDEILSCLRDLRIT